MGRVSVAPVVKRRNESCIADIRQHGVNLVGDFFHQPLHLFLADTRKVVPGYFPEGSDNRHVGIISSF